MSKVVLDTNVFIASYFNRRSASARIIDLCLRSKHKMIFSSRLHKETEMVLQNVRADEEFQDGIRELFKGASRVNPVQRVTVVEEDPEDNKFLECALQGKADYLITSDRHLLELKEFVGTKICKPTQFLRLQRA